MITFSDANKTKLMTDFGIFDETTKSKAAFSKAPSMIGYTIVAIPVGATKLITGIVYTAMQAFRALSELFTTKKGDRTAFREMKFGLALIGKALLQIIPVMNAFAKLYQIHYFKKAIFENLTKKHNETKSSALTIKNKICTKDQDSLDSCLNHIAHLIKNKQLDDKLNPETVQGEIQKMIDAVNNAIVLANGAGANDVSVNFNKALEPARPADGYIMSQSTFNLKDDYTVAK